MSTQILTPIEVSVVVDSSPEHAFRVFTEQTATWWPLLQYSVFEGNAAGVAFEQHVGGRILERSSDGQESSWGEIAVWEPPFRLVFSWHPGHTQDETPTEVEVRFREEGQCTIVELEHRGWERLGASAAETRASYAAGWATVFGAYERVANAA
jgi:uncharacterized protein YndB with AHSA1/START domain